MKYISKIIKQLQKKIEKLNERITTLETKSNVKEWKEHNKICHIAPYRKDNKFLNIDRQQQRNRSISCMVDMQADRMSLYQEI